MKNSSVGKKLAIGAVASAIFAFLWSFLTFVAATWGHIQYTAVPVVFIIAFLVAFFLYLLICQPFVSYRS